MRKQTFLTQSVDGVRIVAVLDMDARDYQGRVRGSVRFYDTRFTGTAPRGSRGQGFTVDGQFITSYYAEEFEGRFPQGLTLDGGNPSWSLARDAAEVVRTWVRLVYRSQNEEIPVYITPLGR